MIKWLFANEWRSKLRSTFWQQSVAVNVILVLLGAYLALNFLILGFALDVILEDAFTGRTALESFNALFLYYLLFDLLIRFFLQSFPLLDVQPYLLLPVNRRKVFHFILTKSVIDFFNFLPLLMILPFGIKVVFSSYPPGMAWTWLATLLLLIGFNHFISFFLKRNFSVRPLFSILLLAALVVLVVVDIEGLLPLSNYFGQLIDFIATQPLMLALPLAMVGGAYYLVFRAFSRYIYLDALAAKRPRRISSGQNIAILDRFGKVGELVQLDLKLILRNKRPRTMLSMALLFLLYPLLLTGLEEAGYGLFIVFGIITVGMATANHGQYMLSWESNFFDFLMARNFSMRDYYEAKFLLFVGFTGVAWLLSLLYGFIDPVYPVIFTACAIFHIGFNSFVTMVFSVYNTRKIDPEKGAFFNFEGVGASQFVYTLPIFLMPLFIYLPFGLLGRPYLGFLAIALVGIACLLMRNTLLDWVTRRFWERKYTITAGFRRK